ncbi:MotA/TolQ/ExbB proton channel family protein [Bermanella sp. WJH001]|uniref:MotA/TolQ/ExbB proton channel family protein n=1 Tax=Bermanella sp. WJH001 TaxID=3048005 RepID=UPI0024BD8F01|nr:MotA/TolQ/ExbB proton channel family protein [Bermanella sp. WJH001]MDJ1538210.1 MotA/TolQ/ExbB proton channel family protein [Bermanella sp. WJH001]
MKITLTQLIIIFFLFIKNSAYGDILDDKGIKSLDELLITTKNLQQKEQLIYKEREARFLREKNQQQLIVDNAKSDWEKQQAIGNPLIKVTQDQKRKLDELQKELDKHVSELGDIHSLYSQFSGDFIARLQDSLVQAQIPERQKNLTKLQEGQTLASIKDMKTLWLLVMTEMTEAGKNSTFQATVVTPEGKSSTQNIIRMGTFSAFSNGQFLHYIPQNQELLVIAEQPSEHSLIQEFSSIALNNTNTKQSTEPVLSVIDPTRGELLALLGQSPSLYERLLQGKEVGYAIVILGAIGIFIILYRLIFLGVVWKKTNIQLNNLENPNNDNPLGRIFLQVKSMNPEQRQDDESLQLVLDEAIIKELPKLEQGHSLIKLFSAIAPLLGLLGTVIGMIATFQSISLFGSGDPKLMASGISQALVTTVLGLLVAIPLLLGHNILVSFSKILLQILDEQSAGILAKERESSQGIFNKEEVKHA